MKTALSKLMLINYHLITTVKYCENVQDKFIKSLILKYLYLNFIKNIIKTAASENNFYCKMIFNLKPEVAAHVRMPWSFVYMDY